MMPPGGQATPLRVEGQQQQQAESGGFWSTLKEIFTPPPNAGPNPRTMFDNKRGNRGEF
jgi:hypothetical protein